MRKEVLEKFLGEKVKQTDLNTFESVDYQGEYLVLTDKEADEKAQENILESLWAFNADFILKHTKNYKNMYNHEKKAALDALKDAQAKSYESLNGLIFAMIEDINLFVENAIEVDGRGHFISWYDGEENEQDGFFIYRIN